MSLPPFNVTLPQDYNHFLRWVTDMRKCLTHEMLVHGVGRLPTELELNASERLRSFTLSAGDHQVTLWLRSDDLYVVGFVNGHGTFEFEPEDNRPLMLTGSTNLRFGGGYTAGIGAINLQDAILGRLAAESAIRGLAQYNGGHNDDLKYWLRTVIINFIESIRFHSIADRVHRVMSNPYYGDIARRQLTADNNEEIHFWGDLSLAFVRSVGNPTGRPYERFHEPRQICDNIAAARLLGIALSAGISLCRARHPRAAADETTAAAHTSGGIVLADVVGVRVRNINNCDPGKLYGKISIADAFGTQQLFNRDKDNVQSVGPNGWADIAGVTRAVSGVDDFLIDVDLKDHYSLIISDRQVARGQVAWNSRDRVDGDYNDIRTREVSGEHGCVEVHYAVLTDAVVARVRVVPGDDGESNLDVYGTVKATTTTADGKPLVYMLFDTDKQDTVGVPKETAIPLKKKVVPTALCSTLKVEAHLWDKKFIGSDKHLAHGDVSFTPSLEYSTSSLEITGGDSGKYKVTVEVTWSI